MSTETLHLKLTQRARRRQHLSHLSPALLLIMLGVQALLGREQENRGIAMLGLVAGLALLVALQKEFRRKQHSHGRVGWFDVIAGVVIILEGAHELHPGRWFQPGILLMVIGAVTMAVGFLHHRLPKLRKLTCSSDRGFSIRVRPAVRLSMPWDKVEAVELENQHLLIRCTDESFRRINMQRIENRAEAAEMMKRHLGLHNEATADATDH